MSFADYGFAIWETFYVTVLSTAFSLVLGLPLGVLLVAGDKDGVLPLPGWLMHILNIVINILRSVPFHRSAGGRGLPLCGPPRGDEPARAGRGRRGSSPEHGRDPLPDHHQSYDP